MKTSCPACVENGDDRSGDNMEVYADGHGYCFKCGHYEPANGKTRKREIEEVSTMKVEEILSLPIRRLAHKPISKDTCEKYGVRVEIKPEGGIGKVYYPYNNNTAFKVKDPEASGKKKYHWVGDVAKATLFGLDKIKKKGKLLIITEGEDDCLAVYEMLKQMGKDYSVVSIPNGANTSGKIDKNILQEVERISEYEQVILCFDSDAPGQAFAQAMAAWLVPFTKVRITELPRKDSAEMLMNNETGKWWQCFCDSEEFRPNDIKSFSDFSLESLMTPLKKGVEIPFPILQDKLQGLRPELSIFCAGSGVGKTTILREIGYSLVENHGLKVGHIFLEEGVEKTALSYIAIDNNVPIARLRVDPEAIPRDRWEASYNKFVNGEKLFFLDHFGSLASDALISKLRYLVHACGADFIILDHISMVISGQASKDERKDIDMLMTKLAAFVNEVKVGILAVVHLRRAQNKSFTEGSTISLNDLRGSGALEQLSWNVIALERDQQDEENKNRSQIRLLKNREWGALGLCDVLEYSNDTGRLLPKTVEEYD